MTPVMVRDTLTVFRDPYAYASHPTLALLNDGDWVAVFNYRVRREARMHPPDEPLFRNMLTRSGDKGRTWERPWCAPDYDWYGVECPGLTQLSCGTVVLTQWRWGWYPLGQAKRRFENGEDVRIHLGAGKGWTSGFAEEDWARSRYPYARGHRGLFAHLSFDGARSFAETIEIDTAPYPGGFTRTGVVQLSDGRVAYVLGAVPDEDHVFVVFSSNWGLTWTRPVTIAATPGFDWPEPHVVEVAPGELLCIIRDSGTSGYLHASRSRDDGKTWSPVARTPMFGHPGHLLKLSDGRLLCTYGHRRPPFGIRASLSEDGGHSWLIDQEVIVRDDLPNADLGYPTTIEYEPSRLFCIYYGQDADGVTCIQGTHLTIA